MLYWAPVRDALLHAEERAPPMNRSLLTLLLVLAAWPASARASELYVTNTHSGTISVIDTTRDEVVATIALGGGVPNRHRAHARRHAGVGHPRQEPGDQHRRRRGAEGPPQGEDRGVAVQSHLHARWPVLLGARLGRRVEAPHLRRPEGRPRRRDRGQHVAGPRHLLARRKALLGHERDGRQRHGRGRASAEDPRGAALERGRDGAGAGGRWPVRLRGERRGPDRLEGRRPGPSDRRPSARSRGSTTTWCSPRTGGPST